MFDSIDPQPCLISQQFREAVLSRFYRQQPSEVQLLLDECGLAHDARLNTVIVIAPNKHLAQAILGSRFRFAGCDTIEVISGAYRSIVHRGVVESMAVV